MSGKVLQGNSIKVLLGFILYALMWVLLAFIPMIRAEGGYIFGGVLLITIIYVFYLITKCRKSTDQKSLYRSLVFLSIILPFAIIIVILSQIQC